MAQLVAVRPGETPSVGPLKTWKRRSLWTCLRRRSSRGWSWSLDGVEAGLGGGIGAGGEDGSPAGLGQVHGVVDGVGDTEDGFVAAARVGPGAGQIFAEELGFGGGERGAGGGGIRHDGRGGAGTDWRWMPSHSWSLSSPLPPKVSKVFKTRLVKSGLRYAES